MDFFMFQVFVATGKYMGETFGRRCPGPQITKNCRKILKIVKFILSCEVKIG